MPRTKHTKTRFRGVYREGEQWFVRVTRRDVNGRRREMTARLDGDLPVRVAVARRAELLGELELRLEAEARGEPTGAAISTLTVAAYAESWLKGKKGRGRKPSTLEVYAEALARLCELHGAVEVSALTRRHAEGFVAHLEGLRRRDGHPYTTDTLRSWWRPVSTMLRDAAADHGLPDPTVRVASPETDRRGARESRTLTGAELGRLLDAVREHAPGWYAEVYVAAFSGLRPGELYALRWEDLNEAEQVVEVRRAHRRGKVGTTKTGDARRIGLSPEMLRLLRDHRARLLREQHPGLASGLVFPSATGGYRGPEALLKRLGTLAERAGIEQRLGGQVLRRTFNTLALDAGVNPTALRDQIGHVDGAMTQRYYRTSAENRVRTVEAVEAVCREERE